MEYTLIITDEASFDIIDAYNWYYAISEKVSFEFEKDIENILNHIAKNPKQFQLKYKKARIVFLKKFPFGIHYLIDKNVVKVIAVFHTSRNPISWQERMKAK